MIVLLMASPIFAQEFENFITAEGYKLMDGDKPLRFISWNIPNINYVEDDMDFTSTNPYGLPNEYELRDAFETIKEMGGQVIRTYTIPVYNSNFPEDAPTFVLAPGEFNEEAFKVMDMMLALANEYQIRLIFSLLNNWKWMGGVPNYAEFRNKEAEEFWTDPQLRDDFKKTIEFTLNRKNSITGVKYKDDKSILCWETGNEIDSPDEWTNDIAAFIKSIDENHLLMDGYLAIDTRPVKENSIRNPNIDIISSHHYQRSPFDLHKDIDMNLKIINGRKPYILGEFGFESSTALESLIDRVVDNEQISGALCWSIRYHHRDGGFYWHSEPLGVGIYKAYHWPGFNSGSKYDEKNFLKMYVDKAYEIQGIDQPQLLAVKPPELLPIENVYSMNWRGIVGASGYNVERASEIDGPWDLIGYNVSDASIQNFPIFHDETAEVGQKYFYRVRAIKPNGISEPSNVQGPVDVTVQAVVDNLSNFGKLYDYHNVKLVTGNDRTYKEIDSRLKGDYGAEIYYNVPGDFVSLKIYSFEENTNWPFLRFYGSTDGEDWIQMNPEMRTYASNESNYNYANPTTYSLEGGDYKFIKIKFMYECEIARVEITHK